MSIAEIFESSIYLDLPIAGETLFSIRNRIAWVLARTASYLTSPIAKAHELFRRVHLVDTLNQHQSKIVNFARKAFLTVVVAVVGFVGVIPAGLGICLRAFQKVVQPENFFHFAGPEEKILGADLTFTLLSWNVCCIGGGYSVSDGGVMPRGDRVDSILEKVNLQNADVNCFYEIFDINTATYFQEKLKPSGYSHFYFHFGPKAVGATSGMFIASKYRIENPEFTPFTQEMLTGRTKKCSKGVFAFDLISAERSFATIFTTHLQHSEEPAFPTEDETLARARAMELIVDKVQRAQNRCVIVTGDLNLGDEEYEASDWKNLFEKGDHFDKKTWGGDGFCASLVGKRRSPPINLDYTMASVGSVSELYTELLDTGFDGEFFREEALSDHHGLLSRITLL